MTASQAEWQAKQLAGLRTVRNGGVPFSSLLYKGRRGPVPAWQSYTVSLSVHYVRTIRQEYRV